MSIPNDTNTEKLSEVALAILWLTAQRDGQFMRAWKGMDWDLLNSLHAKGWIHDPIGKQKSIVFSLEGEELAEELFEKHFGSKPK